LRSGFCDFEDEEIFDLEVEEIITHGKEVVESFARENAANLQVRVFWDKEKKLFREE